jgi:hypothetical protein
MSYACRNYAFEGTLTLRIYLRVWVLVRCAKLDDIPHALIGAMHALDAIVICWSAYCQN